MSYCISIDAIDLKYLPITNYTQKKNAKLFDISSAKRHDYVEFEIFASKANNETAAIPPHCTTICQICNITIPSCYITEHNQSIIHKMYSTIAENALECLKKYLNANNYVSDAKKLLYSFFCDVCCLAVLESEKEIHEQSQTHCKALKKVKQLQDFLHFYSVGLFAADNEEELCDNSNDKSTAINAADEDTGVFKGDTVFKFCDLEVKQDIIEIESFVEPKPGTLDNIRAVKSEDAKVITKVDPKAEREVTEDKAVFKPEIKTNKVLNQTESEVMPEQASIQLREGTIEIELSGGTIVNVSEYQYNGFIILEDNITICLLCNELVKNSLSHKETSEKHLRIMKIPIENTNCIRQIADKFNHCILCNEIFTDIKAHLDSNELHLSRKASAVEVSGENAPKPIESFASANLSKFVVDNILKSGYKRPTPIQKQAIPIIMGGRDLMGCAQTGSGKTAAFLLPIINVLLQDERELVTSGGCAQPQVIIVSPTRELTLQIFNEARKFSYGSIIKIAVAYGGTAVRHQGDQIARGCHILVATPVRLHDFVDRNRISFGSVRFIVLDEADRMLDMGFIPSVEKMMDHPSMVPADQRQTLMFSATFPEEIQHLAGRFLNNYLFVAVGIVGGARTDVKQIFVQVTKYEKRGELKKLIEENEGKRVLVFVETKLNADFIAAMLSEQQLLTSSIHGGRMQKEREEALENFKSGRHCILVATAVAARGLDIKNVDIVVNYDLPKSIDEYVHRIGRTGRVGNRGKAVSFFDSETDNGLVADLAKILRQAEQPVPDFLQGGGTASYQGNKYGGSDIRNFNNAAPVSQGEEPEEEW